MSVCLRCCRTRRGLRDDAPCPECGDPPPPREWEVIGGVPHAEVTVGAIIALTFTMSIPVIILAIAFARQRAGSTWQQVVVLGGAVAWIVAAATIARWVRTSTRKKLVSGSGPVPPLCCSARGVGMGSGTRSWRRIRSPRIIALDKLDSVAIELRSKRFNIAFAYRCQPRDSETISRALPRLERWRAITLPPRASRRDSADRCVGCGAAPRTLGRGSACPVCDRDGDDPTWCVVRGNSTSGRWIAWAIVGAALTASGAAAAPAAADALMLPVSRVAPILVVPGVVVACLGALRAIARGPLVAWLAMEAHLEIRAGHLRLALPWSDIVAITTRTETQRARLRVTTRPVAYPFRLLQSFRDLYLPRADADRFAAAAAQRLTPRS